MHHPVQAPITKCETEDQSPGSVHMTGNLFSDGKERQGGVLKETLIEI